MYSADLAKRISPKKELLRFEVKMKGPKGLIQKEDTQKDIEIVSVKVSSELKHALQEIAKSEGVSLNFYLKRILEDVVSGEWKKKWS